MVFINVKGELFRYYKSCLKAGGIWPLDNHKSGSTIIFSISTVVQVVVILTRLIDPLEKCPPYKPEGIETITTVIRVVAVIELSVFRLHVNRMVPLIESIIDDWSSITDPNEREIMKRHDKVGSFFLCSQIIAFFVPMVIERIMDFPLLNRAEKLDIRSSCAFNDDSFSLYVMSVLNVTIMITYLTAQASIFFFWSSTMHLSGQFKILKGQMQDFLLIKDKEESKKEFRLLIERHKQLLDLGASLEASFSVFMAIHVVIIHFIICLHAFELGTEIASGCCVKAVQLLLNFSSALATFCMYYYAGDYLTECCEEIGEVFTQCEWYALSKESRQNFSIVITRCQRPTTLTLVKLHKLNLYNFKFVVQTLYSYVTCVVAITSKNA